jgi:hypothetical protein
MVVPLPTSHPRKEVEMSFTRRGLVAASTALIVIGAPSAGANASALRPHTEQVLHYFSQFESQVFLTAAGKPFDPSEKDQPVPGDSIDGTDLDFVGNSVHHAAGWTASDHELCILNKENNPVCQAQVAVAGSMILAQADLGPVSASTATSTFEVTGGTGSFQDVTGTIEVVQIDPSSHTSSSNVTITLKRP